MQRLTADLPWRVPARDVILSGLSYGAFLIFWQCTNKYNWRRSSLTFSHIDRVSPFNYSVDFNDKRYSLQRRTRFVFVGVEEAYAWMSATSKGVNCNVSMMQYPDGKKTIKLIYSAIFQKLGNIIWNTLVYVLKRKKGIDILQYTVLCDTITQFLKDCRQHYNLLSSKQCHVCVYVLVGEYVYGCFHTSWKIFTQNIFFLNV